jgi:hypothetical protein
MTDEWPANLAILPNEQNLLVYFISVSRVPGKELLDQTCQHIEE